MYIGHHLFWELKAEMSTTPSVGLFYGLLLGKTFKKYIHCL